MKSEGKQSRDNAAGACIAEDDPLPAALGLELDLRAFLGPAINKTAFSEQVSKQLAHQGCIASGHVGHPRDPNLEAGQRKMNPHLILGVAQDLQQGERLARLGDVAGAGDLKVGLEDLGRTPQAAFVRRGQGWCAPRLGFGGACGGLIETEGQLVPRRLRPRAHLPRRSALQLLVLLFDLGRAAAQSELHSDTGQQLGGVEGLGDVVVGAEIEPLELLPSENARSAESRAGARCPRAERSSHAAPTVRPVRAS